MDKRVLVVDDDASNLMIMARVLATLGYTPTPALNGRQAWHLLNGGQAFDHIISDYDMPEMDGLALLSNVRKGDRFKDLPFTMISASDVVSEENPVSLGIVCEQYGAKFLSKPILDLHRTLAEVIG